MRAGWIPRDASDVCEPSLKFCKGGISTERLQIPEIALRNGLRVPALSVGTYKVDNLREVLEAAFASGLRAVDTAEHYHNEVAVGEAISESGISRGELYLSTKIWNTDHGYQKTMDAFERSVERLRTEPDMLMIHWPCPMNGLYCETWRALQDLLAAGRVRAIGVSNFTIAHLETLKALGGVQPMVNQIEMHLFYIDERMLAYAHENGIQIEAWSPLLRGKSIVSHPLVVELAEKYGVSPAQLAIRMLAQRGARVIVKSGNPAHIRENCKVFGFEIAPEDVERLDSLNTHQRSFQDPDAYFL